MSYGSGGRIPCPNGHTDYNILVLIVKYKTASRLFGASWREARVQEDWPIKEKAVVELTETGMDPGVAHPLKKTTKGRPPPEKTQSKASRRIKGRPSASFRLSARRRSECS
jgi:hypothetical protein